MALIQDARVAVKGLNGIICVYKPAGKTVDKVKKALLTRICTGLNSLHVRPPSSRIIVEGPTNEKMTVMKVENFADNVLVVGPRYLKEDFKVVHQSHLGKETSGVLLIGINEGKYLTFNIHASKLTRAYKVKGELGRASDTFFHTGKTVEKATHKHVTAASIDRVLAYMQAMHQKKMFELCGVHLQSQAAYELASMGPIRPANNLLPVVYGLKCVEFNRPYFTLEIQATNEYEMYLLGIVHALGMQLKSVAVCTGLQCIRHGLFTVHNALLMKHWQLPHILENIQQNDKLLVDNDRLMRPKTAALS